MCQMKLLEASTRIVITTSIDMVTGDTFVKENQELVIANPHFYLDIGKAEQSLTNVKGLQADTYYCYHGGKFIL